MIAQLYDMYEYHHGTMYVSYRLLSAFYTIQQQHNSRANPTTYHTRRLVWYTWYWYTPHVSNTYHEGA